MTKIDYPISGMDLINWRMEDDNCSIPVITIDLSEAISEKALLEALDLTLQRYPLLRLAPAEEHGRLVYQAAKVNPPLKAESGEPFQLRRADGFSPWRIHYRENRLSFCFHHGLTDGRGAFEILKTLLYDYARSLGRDVSSDTIRTLADPSSLIEEESRDPVGLINVTEAPLPQKKPLKASAYKAELMEPDQEHLCRLFVDKEAFMRQVKALETSPFSLASVILCESLKGMFEAEAPVINIGVVSDYRMIYGIRSMHNFSTMSTISYESERFLDKDIRLKCTMFRSVLDVLLQKENALLSIKGIEALKHILSPEPLGPEAKGLLSHLDSIQKETSFILSYIGRFLLPKGLDEMVLDLSGHAAGPGIRLIEMVDFNGHFILNVHHSFKDNAFISAFQEALLALSIPSELKPAAPAPKVIVNGINNCRLL